MTNHLLKSTPFRLVIRLPFMAFDDIQLVLDVLSRAKISVCIVGEIALNYYNVPRVIHVSTIQLYIILC